MVKDADNVIKDLGDWDVGVLPCVDNTWSDVLENASCDLTGRLVQDVREVVFGKKGMGWVRAVGICPGFVLMFAACVNNGGATVLELGGYSIDDGAYKGC